MSSNPPGGTQMRYSTGPPSQNPSGLSNSPANRRPGGGGSAGGGYLSAAAPPGSGAAMSQPRGGGASGSGGIPPRKKRRFADKLIPQQVRELVPESQAYMDLLAFEQKLDSTITRKKLDIQEALKRPIKVKRRLRIYVSHTFIAGKEPEKEGDEGQVPMWELRVEGRLLDDLLPPTTAVQPAAASATTASGPVQPNPTAPAAAAPAAGTAPPPPAAASTAATTPARPIPKRKFSSFFKSLVIELDKDIYGPDNHLVEWHRTPQTNETDGFQVKRPGDRNVKCTILLLLDYQPMKFKLNPRLAKVLGMAAETRPKIIEALWQYIKTHKLQDAVDRDQVNCDSYLEQVFGCRRMRFMEIPQRLQGLLHQPDPIVINHMITYVEGNEKATACYDIDVEIEDPLKQQMAAFVHSQQSLNEIASLDQKINEWKTRRDFFLRFSDNPKEFIQKWLISQSKDLKSMTEVVGEAESERRAEYYHQPQMQEGVFRYIYGKVQQKRAELEASLGVRQN